MSDITFAPPASGSGGTLKPAEVHGHTLIVWPIEVVPEVKTDYGISDAIRVNVHDLTAAADGNDATYLGVLWFPVGLVNSLRSRIGTHLLVRMDQGTPKPGQSPPWTLTDMQDNAAAVAAAKQWLAANPGVLDGASTTFAAPAPAEAPAQRPF